MDPTEYQEEGIGDEAEEAEVDDLGQGLPHRAKKLELFGADVDQEAVVAAEAYGGSGEKLLLWLARGGGLEGAGFELQRAGGIGRQEGGGKVEVLNARVKVVAGVGHRSLFRSLGFQVLDLASGGVEVESLNGAGGVEDGGVAKAAPPGQQVGKRRGALGQVALYLDQVGGFREAENLPGLDVAVGPAEGQLHRSRQAAGGGAVGLDAVERLVQVGGGGVVADVDAEGVTSLGDRGGINQLQGLAGIVFVVLQGPAGDYGAAVGKVDQVVVGLDDEGLLGGGGFGAGGRLRLGGGRRGGSGRWGRRRGRGGLGGRRGRRGVLHHEVLIQEQHDRREGERQKGADLDGLLIWLFVHGTGSSPPRHSGWQRARRQAASRKPRRTPWRAMASRAYSEQVG